MTKASVHGTKASVHGHFDVERRAQRRAAVILPGRLVTERRSFPCLVMNVSASGARVRLASLAYLPVKLALAVDDIGQFPVELVAVEHLVARLRFVDDPAVIEKAFGRILPTLPESPDGQELSATPEPAHGTSDD